MIPCKKILFILVFSICQLCWYINLTAQSQGRYEVGVSHITNKFDLTSESYNFFNYLKYSTLSKQCRFRFADNLNATQLVISGSVGQKYEIEDMIYGTVNTANFTIFYLGRALHKYVIRWRMFSLDINRVEIMEPAFKFLEDRLLEQFKTDVAGYVYSNKIDTVDLKSYKYENIKYEFIEYQTNRSTCFSLFVGTDINNNFNILDNMKSLELQFVFSGVYPQSNNSASRIRFRNALSVWYETKSNDIDSIGHIQPNSKYRGINVGYYIGLPVYFAKRSPCFIMTPLFRLGYCFAKTEYTDSIRHDINSYDASSWSYSYGLSFQLGIIPIQVLYTKKPDIVTEAFVLSLGVEF